MSQITLSSGIDDEFILIFFFRCSFVRSFPSLCLILGSVKWRHLFYLAHIMVTCYCCCCCHRLCVEEGQIVCSYNVQQHNSQKNYTFERYTHMFYDTHTQTQCSALNWLRLFEQNSLQMMLKIQSGVVTGIELKIGVQLTNLFIENREFTAF